MEFPRLLELIQIDFAGKNKNFSVLEEVEGKNGRSRNKVYPYDKKYLKNSGDQTDNYSLNVLNLEGNLC